MSILREVIKEVCNSWKKTWKIKVAIFAGGFILYIGACTIAPTINTLVLGSTLGSITGILLYLSD